jgi:hypothetical protein
MLNPKILGIPTLVLLSALVVPTTTTTIAYAQTTPTQDDIDGDSMPNKSDKNDDKLRQSSREKRNE